MSINFEDEAGFTETIARPHNKRSSPLFAVALAGTALMVLGYAGYKSYLAAPATNRPTANEEFRTASSAPNLSLSVPAAPTDNRLIIAPPPPPVVSDPPPVIVAPQMAIPDDDSARRAAEEAERLQREAEEKRLARLQSNMIVMSESRTASAGSAADFNADPSSASDEDEPDANRRFVNRSAARSVERIEVTQNLRTDALIPQGTLIRGVLETALQSDLPGMVRAIITSDIYSHDGRRILLPKGTMLTGDYKSGIARGQSRVLIVWTRALRADGTSVSLGSYGTDDLGRSGLNGFVDKHYLERFGAASVLSLVGGLSSFIAGLNVDGSSSSGANNGADSSNSANATSLAQQTVSQTMSDMANQALKESISIPPTIHIDQGTPIMVFVRRDLDFSSLYPDPVKEVLNELRRTQKH